MIASLVWTAVALVGATIQFGYLLDTIEDRSYWVRHVERNPSLGLVLRQHVVTAAVRFGVIVAYLGLGGASFLVTPQPPANTVAAVYAASAAVVLIGGEVCLVTLTWMDRRLRRKLAEQAELDREAKGGDPTSG